MESIRLRFHHNILKNQTSTPKCGRSRQHRHIYTSLIRRQAVLGKDSNAIILFITHSMDDSVRESSQDKFETEDEDDEDDIFVEADCSIAGTCSLWLYIL